MSSKVGQQQAESGKAWKQFSVAYLVNYYPKTSHRFIWREITSLEDCGVRVERFATRPSADTVPDPEYQLEFARTRVLLSQGAPRLLASVAWAAATRPQLFLQAARTAIGAGWRSDRGLIAHLAYLAEAALLLRWLVRRPVDHLHAHFATNTASIAMLCRMLGGPPYSFTAHGPDDFDRAHLLGLEQKIARAKVVFSVSSFGRSQLLRWCSHPHWSKVHVMPPGVDATFLLAPTPIPAAPRFVCVGRLHEQKGQLLLIEAVGQLKAEGVRCELVLIGDGPMRSEIEHRIHDLQLQDCITLSGAASTAAMIGIIQSSRALVLPSFAENLPSVIMEVFALARPVIATYVGGIPELVEPGISGWLVPAGNLDALVDAMRQVLAAPVSRLEEMGLHGAQRVRSENRFEMTASRLLAKFRNADDIP
jgi:glycosyltransferase involved in cell wall biosynthesis